MWLAIGGAGGAVFGTVIRLKANATVEAHGDVRLGDVATVSDSDAGKAQALADTVVLSDVEQPEDVTAETILLAVMAQRGAKVVGSDLEMSGAAACTVTIGAGAGSGTGKAAMQAAAFRGVTAGSENAAGMAGASMGITAAPAGAMGAMVADVGTVQHGIGAPEVAGGIPASAVGGAQDTGAGHAEDSAIAAVGEDSTLTQVIMHQVESGLNRGADDVRVTFNTINPLLDSPVDAGTKWLCRPVARALLGTVEFEAQLVQGKKILQRLNVETRVLMRQRVVVTMKKIARGDVVAAADLNAEDQWIDRTLPTLFGAAADAAGLEATRDVDVGGALDQRDFRQALMAHKNEPVSVIYVTGSLQVEILGRSMDDGKLHDRIDVRNETTGEKYSAVLIARNLAVAGGTLTAEQEKKLTETQE